MTKKILITFSNIEADENGNFIIAKTTINQHFEMIVASIYGPNTDSPLLFENVKKICFDMAEDETPVLIAGNLNMALNSEIDTYYNYVRENNAKARNCVLRFMEQNNMIDVCLCFEWGR